METCSCYFYARKLFPLEAWLATPKNEVLVDGGLGVSVASSYEYLSPTVAISRPGIASSFCIYIE